MSARPILWKSVPPQLTSLHLPSLPVPDLIPSLSALKDSLKPFALSDQEYAAAIDKIDHFISTKQASQLHSRLLKRAQQTPHWLEQWWDDTAYLGYRDSVRLPSYCSSTCTDRSSGRR